MVVLSRSRHAVARTAFLALRRLRGDSLLRNGAYNMAATIITALLGYVYWVVAARVYQPRTVGFGAAIFSAMTLAALLANLGLGSALVAALPGRSNGYAWSRTLNAALVLSLLSGAIVGSAVTVILPLFSAPLNTGADPFYTLLFVVGVALWTVSTTLDGAFVAEQATGQVLARGALFAVVKILLLVTPFLQTGPSGTGILMSWILATAISCVVGLVQLSRLGRGYRCTMRGMVKEMRQLPRSLAGQHLINLGGSAPMYLLPLLVTARLSTMANAYFYTAWKVGSLFFMISPAVAVSLFAEGAHRPEALPDQTRRASLMIAALLAPALLVFLPIAPMVMGLFGVEYARHGLTLLALLVLSAIPDALTNVYVSMLRVRGQVWRAAGLNVGMAVVALALAWVALPRLGIEGAGLAWLIAQICGSVFVAMRVGAAHRRSWSVYIKGGRAPSRIMVAKGRSVDV
jgi:O-antigen/teichoic acid export membrane protein